MRNRLLKLIIFILVLIIGVALGILLKQNQTTFSLIKKPLGESYIKFDDTRQTEWSQDFEIVDIESSADKSIQKSYFLKSKSKEVKPLIVSLHTWSGYYNQQDDLAEIVNIKI